MREDALRSTPQTYLTRRHAHSPLTIAQGLANQVDWGASVREKIMTFAPIPSADEIIRLYVAGELSAELASYHETVDDEERIFTERCLILHNSRDIDLTKVPAQPAFSRILGHAFFILQHFYCEVIPRLETSAAALMECCRILIKQAGADGAASQPNGAFRAWCHRNPNKRAEVIGAARMGDELAKQFVTFALHAADDAEMAIDFVQTYTDDRRISGMTAIGGITFADAAAAHKAIRILEPFIADSTDDHVRANAILVAFDVLVAAAKAPGPLTLGGLAQIVWLKHSMLDDQGLRTALLILETVDPEHLGTIRMIDSGLRCLLDTKNEALALNFLTAKLRDGKLSLKNFEATSHELRYQKPQRQYELVVQWLLSGNDALCNGVFELVRVDKDYAFDSTVEPFLLTAVQKILLCRKVVGYLFTKPVTCCSIIVSILRTGDREVEDLLADLLFNPMLLSYGGKLRSI
jgi:hypothetical protein